MLRKMLQYLRRNVTFKNLEENALLATNIALFCSTLVNVIVLKTLPCISLNYYVYKFILRNLKLLVSNETSGVHASSLLSFLL